MKKLSFLTALLCASLFTFADPIVSEYCGEIMQAGTNTEAAFTWETNDDGSIVITISETLGGADDATHFRGNALAIGNFKVGEGKADGSNYFSHPGTTTGNQLVLTATNAPAIGEKIYYNGIVEYATSKDGNAWPTLTFEYTYGSKCPVEESVLTRIVLNASATFAKIGEEVPLTAQAKDQANKNMDAVITFEVSPADAGEVADGKYIPAKVGEATITAKSGDVSASVVIFGVPSDNLALNQPCEAGYEPGNENEISTKANDGDTGTQWVTYVNQPASVEWWIVDLGAKYDIAAIDVVWGDPTSTSYILQVRDNTPSDEDKADDEAWETVSTQEGITINSEQFIALVGVSGRFVRLHSLAKSADFFRLKEVRVFGTEWVPADDNEKPVMVSAELDSKTAKSAVISVSATDNIAIKSFHFVDAANEIDLKLPDTNGKVTISNLTPATAYNFTITAIDAANNESENSKNVQFTTGGVLPTSAAPVPTWPAAQVKSLYSDAYAFAPASLNSYNEGWWNNPNMTEEAIGEDHYLHYDLYRNGMIGVQFAELSVATMEKIHIDIFASAAGTITFRPITAGGPGGELVKTLTLEAQKWNSFDIDMTDFEGHNWSQLYQYSFEGYQAGGLVGEHISVDNIYFYRTTAIVDNEKPTNVVADRVSESYFSVVLAVSAEDNSGAVNFTVLNGEDVLATTGGASAATVNVTVPGLKPNTEYNLSVVAADDAGNEADAVSVAVKTLAAPAPAPAPDFADKDVVAVFCDALENNPAIKIGDWGQATQVQLVELAENDHVYFCTNFNYLGWELTPAANATGMDYLHVDIFAPEMTGVSVTPISPGKELPTAQALTPGQWNSLDIALSVYESAEIAWDNVFQFKFDAPVGGKELFIDNVFFYKPGTTSLIESTINVSAPVKFIENGQLLILRNGQIFTIQGTLVR